MGRLNARGAVVLCGGASLRMGRPKALLEFGPMTFLETVVRIVSDVCDNVVVVAAPGQSLPNLPASVLVVHDTVAHQGPLSGMLAGFEVMPSSVEYAYVTGTDTPLLKPGIVSEMFEIAAGHDLAIPFDGHRHHPLAAAYRVATAKDKARTILEANRRRPIFLMEETDAVEVPFERLRQIDPMLESFRNVNTPADYRVMLKHSDRPIPAEFQAPTIRIEFFGVARMKAGVETAEIEAESVGELVAAMAVAFPQLNGAVIVDGRLHPAYMLMRGAAERLVDDETMLKPNDSILLLNLDAGG